MDRLYFRAICTALIGTVVFFAVIFLPAGTLEYWQAWVFFGTFAGLSSLTTVYLALYDRPLLERRLRAGPTAEKTSAQKVITAVGGLVFVGALVVSILDHRFGWSPAVPAWLSLLGDAFGVLGFLIYFLVIRTNRYAASTVEVATGQAVVSTGPYALVRHPMYAGALLMLVWTPLALGSWWGLLSAPQLSDVDRTIDSLSQFVNHLGQGKPEPGPRDRKNAGCRPESRVRRYATPPGCPLG